MAEITTRSGKGSALTHDEMDLNFDNLNDGSLITDLSSIGANVGTKYISEVNRGGWFKWLATGVANGGTIFSASDGGVWVRLYDGGINPKWFGAVGDGINDDTVALQNALNVGSIIASKNDVFSVSALLTSSNTRYIKNLNLISKIDSGGQLLTIDDDFVVVDNCTIDGNQWGYTSGLNVSRGVRVNSNYVRFINTDIKNCVGEALWGESSIGTQAVNCHFDDNNNLGLLTKECSEWRFTNCTFNRNGYGFQQTRANPADNSHGFEAFGVALRFRSHHITFVSCSANDNGRDGFNVNQGSYAIKFIACEALRNDDGGFTIAKDSTEPGRVGDDESPWDLEYFDCEGANNYTGGLVAYQPVYRLQIKGGRYYNNCRTLGLQGSETSYVNNIYVAAGSKEIDIDTKVYDDRQERLTDGSGNDEGGGVYTFNIPGWVTGTALYYPRVAIFNALGSFSGFATIVAETEGSTNVSFITTPFNGADLTLPSNGWTFSQKIVGNGVCTEPGGNVVVKAEGYGFRQSFGVAYGKKFYSGHFTAGQNCILKDVELQPNLLANPGFEVDTTNWSILVPGGGSFSRDTVNARSVGALQLTAGTFDATADASLIAGAANFIGNEVGGTQIIFRGWLKCDTIGGADLGIFNLNGGSLYNAVSNKKANVWEYVELGVNIGGLGGTRLTCRPGVTAYFDNLELVVIGQPEINDEAPNRYLKD